MKRREFIKSSVLAGGALYLASCAKSSPTVVSSNARNKCIRIGIVGVGSRGSDTVKVIQKIPVFNLVAYCDVLDFRLEHARKLIGEEAQSYTDYQQMIEKAKLDAIIITTPLHLHYPVILAAMDAELHIMSEKALTHTLEEAIEVKKRANNYNKKFQVSYQYQLNPVFNTIKSLINEGFCGKITRIESSWHRNNNWRRPLPNPKLEEQINWRMYRKYSAGLMAELGSHQLNMIDNILGASPNRVMGTGGIDYWKDGREVYDNVFTLFDYPGGVKASFSSILANKYEGFSMKFYGDKASIISNSMDEAYFYPERDEKKLYDESVDGVSGASIKLIKSSNKRIIKPKDIPNDYPFEANNYMNTTWLLYKNFAAAILDEEPLKLGIGDAYRSALSVHLANKALYESQIVNWLPEYDI